MISKGYDHFGLVHLVRMYIDESPNTTARSSFSIWAYLVSVSDKALLAKAMGLPVLRSAAPNPVQKNHTVR